MHSWYGIVFIWYKAYFCIKYKHKETKAGKPITVYIFSRYVNTAQCYHNIYWWINWLWPSDTIWLQRVNIGSGNGLLPDGTKPLPEPKLTSHQCGSVASISQQVPKLLFCVTRYVDGTLTSEVTLVIIRYIRPPHQGHGKVIQYISPDLYILSAKHLRFSSNGFDVRGKSCCGGGNKLKTYKVTPDRGDLMSLKMIHLKLSPHLPGANKLFVFNVVFWLRKNIHDNPKPWYIIWEGDSKSVHNGSNT